MITKDDFHICTKATWKRLKHADHAYDLFDSLKTREGMVVVRPHASNSIYVIDEANSEVYRLSDHWERVASCFWMLDRPLEHWQIAKKMVVIAKANFSDFTRYN